MILTVFRNVLRDSSYRAQSVAATETRT